MAKAPQGYLRRPAVAGFMSPHVVLDLLAALSTGGDGRDLDALRAEAQLHRLPGPSEPVREEKAARLHQAVRRLWPDRAPDLLRAAGRATADALLASQQSPRAQAMLAGSPWPIAAWFLGRWAKQHDWTFAGTGLFTMVNGLEYTLTGNPLIRDEAATEPLCHWHGAFFQRLFQRLVSPDLECRELACAAMGAPACRFVIARA
jgi:divinyl protochlorophyllide a 8-vinyl-reductase